MRGYVPTKKETVAPSKPPFKNQSSKRLVPVLLKMSERRKRGRLLSSIRKLGVRRRKKEEKAEEKGLNTTTFTFDEGDNCCEDYDIVDDASFSSFSGMVTDDDMVDMGIRNTKIIQTRKVDRFSQAPVLTNPPTETARWCSATPLPANASTPDDTKKTQTKGRGGLRILALDGGLASRDGEASSMTRMRTSKVTNTNSPPKQNKADTPSKSLNSPSLLNIFQCGAYNSETANEKEAPTYWFEGAPVSGSLPVSEETKVPGSNQKWAPMQSQASDTNSLFDGTLNSSSDDTD